jgi:geranylgeranyl diphosphate synthase type II
MYEKYAAEERCRKILEDNGGFLAEKARTILFEDTALKELQCFTEFISKNWRDPLTPALMRLSCEAVGGRTAKIQNAALAMSLMNLSFYVWDDIIDNARHKSFRPTLFGKFGEGPALIIGGIATAKAFSILNKMDVRREKRQIVTRHFWNLWAKMANAETLSFRLQRQRGLSSKEKLWKIKIEASANPGTSLQIGAVLGNASANQSKQLQKYGQSLGVILELIKDFQVSLNLTLELGERIREGALPYSLLLASERSEKLKKELAILIGQNSVDQSQIKQIIQDLLETETYDGLSKQIRYFAEKAKKDVNEVGINYATKTLKEFVDAQPQLFVERLSSIDTLRH